MSRFVNACPCGLADLTGDGQVTLKDLQELVENWLTSMQ
jgi:hypothetical protein